MLADSELALDQLGPEGWWRPSAQVSAGVAHALLGDVARARETLVLATEQAATAEAPEEGHMAFAELAPLAMEAGAWDQAATNARQAVRLAEDANRPERG
jgi:hypothetical protein